MILPKHLINQINQGNVVLFLGAGASFGAKHPKNKSLPLGQKLSDNLALKFLDETYKGKPLQYVAELAISESDLYSVQKYIYDEFIDFTPGSHHNLISSFKWSAIVTTNYDFIIENVYSPQRKPLQTLITFKKNGERIEEKLTDANGLVYYKLHGCMAVIDDPNLPLILTPDQYVTHQDNRSRLFERVKDLSYEHPFLFVGYSLADPDIRAMLSHLDKPGSMRPQSYMVGPNVTDVESRLWSKKNITAIKLPFDEFLTTIDGASNSELRKLVTVRESAVDLPIKHRFKQESNIQISDSLTSFLENDVSYIHLNLPAEPVLAQDFYKGYFPNWSPIINNYDVERRIKDNLLSEIFLRKEEERPSKQDFYVIKGHAGSGKTVFLKRIAWDAAIEFDQLCLYLNTDVAIKYEPLEELYTFCKERIFLFVDSPADYIEDLKYILKRANKAKLPLTIISAERVSTWNTECKEIFGLLTEDYTLGYLSDDEILKLINNLDKYDSLGYLKNKSLAERVSALSEIHGRELLVALHEATMGKPFEQIVFNEYKSIKDKDAQALYLSICVLHRLGAQTRAGLISRAHNITFTDFETKLFLPLESIVFAKRNYRINDYVYLTRHPHIAEIVFESALVDVQSRFDEYIRIISALDVDYESDRHAFTSMTNARKLMQIFKDAGMLRNIFDVANKRSPNNPKLLQQEAIFEMQSGSGNLINSEKLLFKAYELAPKDQVIAHSLAEFYLKKAEFSSQKLIRAKYLDESKKICLGITRKGSEAAHAYHTLIKINLLELEEVIKTNDIAVIEKHIKDTEKLLSESKVSYPNQSFILEIESKFNELIENSPKALESLIKAFEYNKRSTFIALRLANYYERIGKKAESIDVIKQALEINQNDKDLNFKFALGLSENSEPDWSLIRHYLRKSFTLGDTRYEAQFWYARCLYILNDLSSARAIFDFLKDAKLDSEIKKTPRGEVFSQGQVRIFQGVITSVETSFGFIRRDEWNDSIYFIRSNENIAVWDKLIKYQRVRFKLQFNYRGAVATDISKI